MTRKLAVAAIWLAAMCGEGAAQTVAGAAAGWPQDSAQDSAQGLDRQIAAVLTQPAVSRAHWGVKVTALDGTPIYSLNEAQFFQPASNTKLFTTATAMALLGAQMTFDTQVVGTVDAASGTVTGDLSLVGGGEGNLSGRELPYATPGTRAKGDAAVAPADPLRYLAEMADQVAAKGVRLVTGDVVGYDTLFPWEPFPSDWSIDDMVWGYGAPVSALTINDNQLKVTVAPAAVAGRPAMVQVWPATPYYTLDVKVNTEAAKAGSRVRFERAPGSKVLHISGGIAVDSPPDVEEVAIQDPAEYAAMALKGMLEARGIAVKGVARAMHWEDFGERRGFLEQTREPVDTRRLDGTAGLGCSVVNWPQARRQGDSVLATHRSAPLVEDVMVTNKVSQNLHAELMLHQLGLRLTCFGTAAQGARVVRSFLTAKAGIDKDDFVFYDGSGLSGHDLVTPRATARLLSFATTQPWFADWKASLPVGGEDSGLAARFAKTPLKDHVFAKTGTLGEARALSGYLDCASGKTVIFSVMVTSHMPGGTDDRDAMDKIVAAIQAAE